VILALRNMATRELLAPKNFLQNATFIYQTGHAVPINDATKKLRVKLGLTENPPTTHMYSEFMPGVRKILDGTGLMAIKAQMDAKEAKK